MYGSYGFVRNMFCVYLLYIVLSPMWRIFYFLKENLDVSIFLLNFVRG